jgi:hypothetical protein
MNCLLCHSISLLPSKGKIVKVYASADVTSKKGKTQQDCMLLDISDTCHIVQQFVGKLIKGQSYMLNQMQFNNVKYLSLS